MFSSPRFLVYVTKPSSYYLRSMMPEQKRIDILLQAQDLTRKILVSPANPMFSQANQIIVKRQMEQIQKYEDSFLWSPIFTPTHFKFFLLYFSTMCLFIAYLHYIHRPRHLVKAKLKYGINFPEYEQMGLLDGWYEQYIKVDKVLKFQAYTLQDMQRLHKEGMLSKTPEQVQKNIQKKKSKFIRGKKQFLIKQFKST